jgi:hypothetical protein
MSAALLFESVEKKSAQGLVILDVAATKLVVLVASEALVGATSAESSSKCPVAAWQRMASVSTDRDEGL